MTDVSSLASFPFVRMCQIDGLEGIKKFGDDPYVTLGDIAENERGANNCPPPPVERGLYHIIDFDAFFLNRYPSLVSENTSAS